MDTTEKRFSVRDVAGIIAVMMTIGGVVYSTGRTSERYDNKFAQNDARWAQQDKRDEVQEKLISQNRDAITAFTSDVALKLDRLINQQELLRKQLEQSLQRHQP